ncbi:Fe-S cluster assembly protein SufB [Candidatus Gracilibacteria bacterium]|nr:Fe-S cluster assembly protein SufB [Candidatus Gracilibacteria bacterium]MCF7819666.1 Fe-S cluster assembly protein SufB [Candidatus Gracilibacteria bacterium]
MSSTVQFQEISRADLDTPNTQKYAEKFRKGLTEEVVREISADKKEPQWMLEIRLKALKIFHKKKIPTWGPDLRKLDFTDIRYFSTASENPNAKTWEEVDPEIKRTFERLKIPEAERAVLAGVGAQYESENVYHNIKKEWEEKGVIFEDFDVAVQKYPDLVRKYFSRSVPLNDHKFAALHYAVTSGGTFLYVPKGVKITQPLQAYFRMNSMNQGQFEHTLIVVEEGADVHYIEGCSAPKYGSQALHAGCVEVFVEKGAKARYSSVENWSKDTYNLNTKRALVHENARMEWIGGNLGSGVTMLYPCSILIGDNAQADHLGVAFANTDQNQDTGAKIIINGKNCRAKIVSKSLAKGGGITTYRGLIDIKPHAENATVNVECDALMLDDKSVSDTIPHITCDNPTASMTHEASAGKISEEVLLYFQSRGIDEETAKGMIVNGFLDEIVKTLPLEYAVELNRLIELEMEGSVG